MTPAERQAFVARRDQEKVKASDRARYRRDHAKRRAANDAYTQANPEPVKVAKAAWAARNPEKRKAQHAVSYAIRSGSLQQGPCESAGPECTDQIHAHHDDYSKPLEVRWLCTWHHTAHHVEARGLS